MPLLFAKLNNSQLWKKTNLIKNSPLQGGYILPAAKYFNCFFYSSWDCQNYFDKRLFPLASSALENIKILERSLTPRANYYIYNWMDSRDRFRRMQLIFRSSTFLYLVTYIQLIFRPSMYRFRYIQLIFRSSIYETLHYIQPGEFLVLFIRWWEKLNPI